MNGSSDRLAAIAAEIDSVRRCLSELLTSQNREGLKRVAEEPSGRHVAQVQRMLSTQLCCALREFLHNLELAEQQGRPLAAPAVEDGGELLCLDALAARFVRSIGESGTAFAEKVVENGKRRWVRFVDAAENAPGPDDGLLFVWQDHQETGLPRFLSALVKVLRTDVVEPQVLDTPRPPAALSTTVVRDIARILRPNNRLCRDGTALVDDHHTLAVLDALRSSVDLLRTLPAHRLVRFLVLGAHDQYLAEERDFRTLRVQGGWKGLAEVLGCGSSKSAVEQVQQILQCLAHLRLTAPDGLSGNLLAYVARPARGGLPPTTAITVGDLLLPGAVLGIDKRTLKGREARQLVPVPPLPPFYGRQRDWGAQANLQLLFMRELQGRTEELTALHGATIPRNKWLELGDEAGVSHRTIADVVETWVKGNDNNAPFLRRLDSQSYTLADGHARMLDFLVAGALRRQGGRSGGRKSSKARSRRSGGDC